MATASEYILEPIRDGVVFTLYRARQRGHQSPLLVVAPTAEQPLPQSLRRLEHEFSLATELKPAWAAKPLAPHPTKDGAAEGRSAVYDLRASAITTNDLAAAVNAVGGELTNDNTAAFNLIVEGPTRDPHPIMRDEVYRISRDALTNTFKHARARHIEATISYEPRAFRLQIGDDAEGIPAEVLNQGRAGHFGLSGVRERARQIGAELTIGSRPGAGMEIDLSVASTIAYSRRLGDPSSAHSNKKGDEK